MVPPGNLRQHRELGQVVHEGDMIEVLKTRPDFCYLCDVAPKDSTKRMEHQTAWVFQPDKNPWDVYHLSTGASDFAGPVLSFS